MKQFLQTPLLKRATVAFCLLCLVLATLFTGRASAQPAKKMDVDFSQAPLRDVFTFVESQSGYAVNYFKDELDPQEKISLRMKQATAIEILSAALSATSYSYQVDGRTIIIRKKQETPQRAPGKVSGVLVDEKTGEPIPGATVRIGSRGTVTDVTGAYMLELPAGTYHLEITSVGYNKKKVTEVAVQAGKVTTLHLTLSVAKGTLKGVEVVGTAKRESLSALYARQKNNSSLSDGISAEQIRRTPDNNVAQVLKRISGLTVQDNKFVVVRGMSERYNNVLLNGSSLPSTEPNRRNFSFDIIPSNLIDNVVVNKTATPDMPGEFTGGLVQVNTTDIPRENFIQLQAGTGFNNNSTGKDFFSTRRLNSDYWGAPGKDRQWLDRSWNSVQYQQMRDNNDVAGMNAMNARIPNNYGLYQYTAKPLQQYQLSMGGSRQLKPGRTLGAILSGTYRHEENIEHFDAWYRASPTIVNDGHEYIFTTAVGAMGNIAYQSPKTKLAWRNIFNRRFSHDNIVQETEDKGRAGLQSEYISLVETGDLFQTRLEGEHQLNSKGIKFNWFADLANVTKEQPDTRYSVAFLEGADPETGKPYRRFDYSRLASSTIKDGGLFAYNLEEKKKNIGGDLTVPFKLNELTQKIKAGYWGTFREAEYKQVSLAPTAYNGDKRVDSIGYGKEDYQVFAPENFAAGILYYMPVSADGLDAADFYDGRQRLHATYLMLDLMPLEKLRVIAGVRYENNTMTVHSTTRISSNAKATDSTVTYKEQDWLPSVNVIYHLTPAMNIRAAYSRTLARPDFRERSSFKYYDIRLRQVVKGIHGLEYSRADNVDIRFEWYPSPVEIISFTAFYKKYEKPVESVSNRYPDNRYGLFYFNLEDAVSKGIEVDYRHSFSFINNRSGFWKNLFLSANFSWMDSRIRYYDKKLSSAAQGLPEPAVDESQATRNRPLQGLSPFILNTGLSYQGDMIGANVTYNRFGRRVVFAGMDDYDDIYENPRDVVDLQLSARLLKQRMEIRLNVSDLLNQYFIEYFNKVPDGNPPVSPSEVFNENDPKGMGYNPASDWTMKRTKKGTSFTFTLSYRL